MLGEVCLEVHVGSHVDVLAGADGDVFGLPISVVVSPVGRIAEVAFVVQREWTEQSADPASLEQVEREGVAESIVFRVDHGETDAAVGHSECLVLPRVVAGANAVAGMQGGEARLACQV